MKHGAVWYQREPLAYLGGVQGLPAALHAVYGVVIDLCYAHGGAIHNDPKWISGWIGDMGSASVRNAIAELVALGKLMVDDAGFLTQKRAKNEAKTREKLRENARETGKKGGILSGKSRAAAKENKALAEGSASDETKQIRQDEIRVEAYASNKESARDALAGVVGWERADAFIAHRKALRAPMTPHAGKLLAKKLAAMSDPGAAVDRAIERGWKSAFDEDPNVHPFPAKRQSDVERRDDLHAALAARLAVQRLE